MINAAGWRQLWVCCCCAGDQQHDSMTPHSTFSSESARHPVRLNRPRQWWEALGVRVEVEAPAASWLHRFGQRLWPAWRPTVGRPTVGRPVDRRYAIGRAPGPARWQLRADGESVGSSAHRSTLLDLLQSDLELFLATRAPRHVVVHAAVVAWRGGAMVLPGQSRTGKTTLTEALLERGAAYYSDECAAFDAEGHVHPYPRPPIVRRPGGRRRRLPVSGIRAATGGGGLPVRQIIVARYREAAMWRPERLSPAQAALELLACCAAARRRPAEVLRTLGVVTARAPAWKGVRGEAAEMADRILAQDPLPSPSGVRSDRIAEGETTMTG